MNALDLAGADMHAVDRPDAVTGFGPHGEPIEKFNGRGVTDASARILDFRGMPAGRAPGYCFLDASQSDPRSLRLADAQADCEAALLERDRHLADAWKNPGAKKDVPSSPSQAFSIAERVHWSHRGRNRA
jgi:hypothetical protein